MFMQIGKSVVELLEEVGILFIVLLGALGASLYLSAVVAAVSARIGVCLPLLCWHQTRSRITTREMLTNPDVLNGHISVGLWRPVCRASALCPQWPGGYSMEATALVREGENVMWLDRIRPPWMPALLGFIRASL